MVSNAANSFSITSLERYRSSDICCSWRSVKFKLPGVSMVKTELKKSDRAVVFSLSVFAQLLSVILSAGIVSVDFIFLFT